MSYQNGLRVSLQIETTLQKNISKAVWLQVSESPRIELPVRRVPGKPKKVIIWQTKPNAGNTTNLLIFIGLNTPKNPTK